MKFSSMFALLLLTAALGWGDHWSAWRGADGTLTAQIARRLKRIQIDAATKKVLREGLKAGHQLEQEHYRETVKRLQEGLGRMQWKFDRLLDLKIEGQVEDENYERKKSQLVEEQAALKGKLAMVERAGAHWFQQAEAFIDSAFSVYTTFMAGDDHQKREVLAIVGSNFVLAGETVHFDLKAPYHLLEKTDLRSNWLRGMDSNHHAMLQRHVSYH